MPGPRRIANPKNPYEERHIDWEGEPPHAELEVFAETVRSALTENTSPDVGFRWSVNPYRGCYHGCAYCLDGATRILMADGRTKPLAEVRVGDAIYGTVQRADYRYYERTSVLAHWSTTKPAMRVTLADGTELIASRDHRFLTQRGWKHVTGTEWSGPEQRPHLTNNDVLMGIGRLAAPVTPSPDYQRGYLTGMIRGDAHLATYRYDRREKQSRSRGGGTQHQFRLALIDHEALQRSGQFLGAVGVSTNEFLFQRATGDRKQMHAIRTHRRANVERIREVVAWPESPSSEWQRGFLAGIFDAEGSCSGSLRISNTDEIIISATTRALTAFGFRWTVESTNRAKPVLNARLLGGLPERMRFFHTTDPAITRKRAIDGSALKNVAPSRLRVISIEPLPQPRELFDITTGTGDFIAEGVVSHNCYARPYHQYLGWGAGTDFERKIVVKTNVAAVLRRELGRKSWRRETIAFSGITDCYQPLEAAYRVTRACLDVCLERRNPVAIITKSSVIRRDVDLLAELARVAGCRVAISIPFADDALARAIEPWASPPSRRFETMRLLSEAGVTTVVGVAPLIPGLNDSHVAEILERARDAGAKSAFMTKLRLPGEVKQVFDVRIEEVLPAARVKRVRHAIAETSGGSGFGERMRGIGARWDAIERLFEIEKKRLGLDAELPAPPPPPDAQLDLFSVGLDLAKGGENTSENERT